MANAPFKNFIVLLGSRAGDNILSFIFFAGISRMLPADSFGLYCYAFSFSIMFYMISNLGLSWFSVREIARHHQETAALAGKLIVLRAFICLLSWPILAAIISLVINNQMLQFAIIGLSFAFACNILTDCYLDVLRAHEEMHIVMSLVLFQRCILLGCGLLGLWKGGAVFWLIVTHIFAAVLQLIIAFLWIHKLKGNFIYKWDKPFFLSVLSKTWPLALMIITGGINFRLDIYMLGHYMTTKDIGFYSTGHRLLEALMFIPLALSTAAFPNLARLYHQSSEKLQDATGAVFKIFCLIAFPMAVALTLFAKPIILTIYGDSYYQSILAMKILGLAGGILFINYLFNILFQSLDKQKELVLYMTIAFVLHFIFGIYFIPLWGINGAACSFLLSEIILCAILTTILYKYFKWHIWFMPCIKLISGGLIVLLICSIFINKLGIFILILGALLYSGIVWKYRPFSIEEISWLKTPYKKTI